MRRTFVTFALATLLSCNEQTSTKVSSIPTDTSKLSLIPKNQIFYKFDSFSSVEGCANIALQKISRDLQYELVVELEFDSIPRFTEIDITKYSKFVKIYLNKYVPDNKYVSTICNDAIYLPENWKPPIEYSAIAGSLKITYWSDEESVVSATIKNLVLKDSLKRTIIIPSETFKELEVGWIGG